MDIGLRRQARIYVPLLLAILIAFSVAACLLTDKIIIDEYDAVFGLPQDVTQEITNIKNTLTGSYCIGVDRKVELSSKITQANPGPTQLDVELAIRDANEQELGSQVFELPGKATKHGSNFPKKKFDLLELTTGNCVPADGSVYVAVTPRNGNIDPLAKLRSRARIW